MKVYEFIKKLSGKIEVNPVKIMEIKKYYLSLYRANMVYLYDNSYISDPSTFNSKEILGNIVDMGITNIVDKTGTIRLESDFIEYALAKNKSSDEETKNFLNLLYEAVKYKEISDNIDKFYEANSFDIGIKKKINIGIVQANSRIYYKSGIKMDEGILRCIHSGFCEYRFVSINEYVYKSALNELGIEDDSEESKFVLGLTRDEEVEFSNLILNGLVRLDGEYADRLVSWLKENKWSNLDKDKLFSSKREGLFNYILFIKSGEALDEQSRVLNELIDDGSNVVGMVSNGFFVEEKCEMFKFPVGVFAVDGEKDTVLSAYNKLEGYTGEAFTLEYLRSNSINYVGSPIILYSEEGELDYYIDKEQTELVNSISWFSDYGTDLNFGTSTYESGVFSNDSLEDRLYEALGASEAGVLISDIKCPKISNRLNIVKKKIFEKVNVEY